MEVEYKVNGMTCGSCVAKVKESLEQIPEVIKADVHKATNTAALTMNSAVPIETLSRQLKATDAKYSISLDTSRSDPKDQANWFKTYKPIIIVFSYISIITLLIQAINGSFDVNQWMRHFMAGFFLVFSFFKMLDLKGFSDSYRTYDILAKLWQPWGFVYAFIELGLGVSYLLNWNPLATNVVSFTVMTISIIGVLRSVFNKQKIQCACLGSVFDLPMSTVTIIEDALMILMSGYMIINIMN
jgi:cation transport ATPase